MNVDLFIESASKLLESYPSSTITITYANELKKSKNKDAEKNDKKSTNSVKFKIYEPNSGKCIKYKTYKIKELSRLLTFLGPRGVTISQSRKRTINEVNEEEEVNKKLKTDRQVPGLASIMSNKKFDQVVEVPIPTNSTSVNEEPVEDSKNKKKKKKKGKK